MSTRSLIAAQFDSEHGGEIVTTYCHYDGYLSGVGLELLTQYNDAERAFMAADAGYLSSLPEFDKWDETSHANEADPSYYSSEEELLEDADNWSAEFVYLYKNGQWYFSDVRNGNDWFSPLTFSDMHADFQAVIAYMQKRVDAGNLSEDEMAELRSEMALYRAYLERAESDEELH